jgi:hypothetical protein
MKHVALLILALFPLQLIAGEAIVSWEHPTQYVDGTTLPLSSIARTELEYGKCNTAKDGFLAAPAPVIVPVAAPATTRTITSLGAGDWCVRARTVSTVATDGISDWTNMAWKTITMKVGPPVSIRVQ